MEVCFEVRTKKQKKNFWEPIGTLKRLTTFLNFFPLNYFEWIFLRYCERYFKKGILAIQSLTLILTLDLRVIYSRVTLLTLTEDLLDSSTVDERKLLSCCRRLQDGLFALDLHDFQLALVVDHFLGSLVDDVVGANSELCQLQVDKAS